MNDWREQAECRKPEYKRLDWFPVAGDPAKKQLAVCAACPVLVECAEDGKGDFYGIRAGRLPSRRTTALCGTLSGRAAHKRRREATCEACRAAQADATRRSRERKRKEAS